MGREIRQVPPNWEHPKTMDYRRGQAEEVYKLMHDQPYREASEDWKREYAEWEAGGKEKVDPKYLAAGDEFWDYHGPPPNREYYRPEWPEGEATWFQVYETVTEGTPVTPPFATREELVDYLVEHGDFWFQKGGSRHRDKPSREAAETFVRDGWAPSMVVTTGAGGTQIRDGVSALSDVTRKEDPGC